MYKIVSEDNHNEVWASGFYDKKNAQKRIDSGEFHKHMYKKDKHKKLILVKSDY